jgi:hypothetical protein
MSRIFSVVALSMLFTQTLRADQIDLQIKKEGEKLIESLKQKGHQSVGVLRFQIQVGEQSPSFSTGMLNAEMIGIVENALVLANTGKEPILLVREVSSVATKADVGDWSKDAKEREKLFSLEYPRAWGNGKQKADALITGLIKVSKDFKKGEILLQLIDAKSPEKIVTWKEIPFQPDAGLMSDLGRSFALKKSQVETIRSRGASDWNRAVLEEANAIGEESNLKSLTDVGGVDFRILADGKDITDTIKRVEGASNEWTMPSPGNAKIVFHLNNTHTSTRAVLLKLNNQNVIQLNMANETQKLFMDPKDPKKKEVKLGGFLRERNGRRELVAFQSLTGEGAQRAKNALGVQEGFITMTVFESLNDESLEAIAVTDRSLSQKTRNAPPEAARSDLKSYQDFLAEAGLMKRITIKEEGVASREVIVPDEKAVQAVRVTTHDYPNPSPVASLTIRILPQ